MVGNGNTRKAKTMRVSQHRTLDECVTNDQTVDFD